MIQAYKQFQATEDWRKANDINVLYDTIDLEAYDAARRLVRNTGLSAEENI